MDSRLKTLFFGLAIFVLINALFILQPGGPQEVAQLKQEVIAQLSFGIKQVVGDQPWFTEIADVYLGTEKLFQTSADILIVMLEPTAAEEDLIHVASQTYDLLLAKTAYLDNQPQVLGAELTVMDPIYNILPPFSGDAYKPKALSDEELSDLVFNMFINPIIKPSGVAGTSVDIGNNIDLPDNTNDITQNPWVDLRDNITGEFYCLAVFNGEVNKYPGPCAHDEYY